MQVEIEPSSSDELHDGDMSGQREPAMVTLAIDGGKRSKVRPGDLLGALTSAGGISGSQVGKIDINDFNAYVAVERSVAKHALNHLIESPIKGRKFKVRRV